MGFLRWALKKPGGGFALPGLNVFLPSFISPFQQDRACTSSRSFNGCMSGALSRVTRPFLSNVVLKDVGGVNRCLRHADERYVRDAIGHKQA
jgi:hypothetical protein